MRVSFLSAMLVLAAAGQAFAGPVILTPMTTFGGTDGWRAPNEIVTGDAVGTATGSNYNYLQAGSLERGLAYNPATGNLVLVSRNAGVFIRVLNGTTGVDLRGLSIGPSGTPTVTGGTFAASTVGVAGDGAVYVANLQGAISGTGAFKVYRWADDQSTTLPTVAFTGNAGLLAGARLGDSLDVTGSGVNTRVAAGYAAAPNIAGNNSYAVFTTNDGLAYTGGSVGFTTPGSSQTAGDFRLGITFGSTASQVYGKQTSQNMEVTTFAGTAGTSVGGVGIGSPGLTSNGEMAMDFARIDGVDYLATLDANSSLVRVYDVTNPLAPVLVSTATPGGLAAGVTTTSGTLTGNGNSVGSIKWGAIVGNTGTLYAMSTNQGIQAFNFVAIPEASSFLAVGAVGMLFAAVRRFRRK